MKQIIQSFKTGETILEDIPSPQVSRGHILIQTTRSLVSLGTERMLVEFGKSNLISKARQQPDKVKQVLDKIKAEGLLPTLETVFNKLGEPLPLGYCNVGKVIAVGEDVIDFNVGDRVASNGPHAEFVNVPINLAAHIPDNVSDEDATFTVVGAIGLQGIRLCQPTLGETIVVIGLGLIGLLTAELLVANGCRVIGVDLDPTKVDIAEKKGIIGVNPSRGDDVVNFIQKFTKDNGADGVIITASAKNNEIISDAAKMCRKRGRIILVGVVGLDIQRADFYEKELTFQVSCSYGPGRYDDQYERKGIDYPLPFVRWTEKRNFEAVLLAISTGKLEVKSLITERTTLENYNAIYDNIGGSKSIASIIEYPENSTPSSTIVVNSNNFEPGVGGIGIIGAGNFTKMTLLPALKAARGKLVAIASAGGVTGSSLAKKYDIRKSTTDYTEILKDDSIDLVLITTRHDQHAKMILEGIQHGKHIFVEKPLALTMGEIENIQACAVDFTKTITVGFNRRFSPHIQKIKSLAGSAPMNIVATMNAGEIPPSSWVHDMKVGGGRIIGEACHFIDLITYLTGSRVKAVCMSSLGPNPKENTDNASILLQYENGSNGVINYFSNGSKAYSKERIEVFSQGRTLIMDNYRSTYGYGFKSFSKLNTKMDKGHNAQFKLLVDRINIGGEALIPFDEIINTSKASLAAIESMKSNSWITL